ncbi:unnamed protein product [Mytilus coruscus]|uniref:Endonuclease/exonuclease/phosphatase domain-containing protein n=1 Tax=Mytilus coruscus TaxID=42192 RepID=A0A6J8C7W8_MYTCO|nr:unnamed protein product [Mytilus coruscus]
MKLIIVVTTLLLIMAFGIKTSSQASCEAMCSKLNHDRCYGCCHAKDCFNGGRCDSLTKKCFCDGCMKTQLDQYDDVNGDVFKLLPPVNVDGFQLLPPVNVDGFQLLPPVNRQNCKAKSVGICVFVSENLCEYVNVGDPYTCSSHCVLWFTVDNKLLFNKTLFGVVYIPPQNSLYSDVDMFSEIENVIVDTELQICLLVDFNAHTSDANEYVVINNNILDFCNVRNVDQAFLNYLHILQEFDLDFTNDSDIVIACDGESIVKPRWASDRVPVFTEKLDDNSIDELLNGLIDIDPQNTNIVIINTAVDDCNNIIKNAAEHADMFVKINNSSAQKNLKRQNVRC